jgi:probable rRNA maturation factor
MQVHVRDLQQAPVDHALLCQVAQATDEIAPQRTGELSLVLVDDDQIHEINRRFRHIDRPTDVISFEADEDDEEPGEVIISVPTAQCQADAVGHSLMRELAWLVSHGVLHVAGMDDPTEEHLEEMLALQRQVMQRLSLDARP